MFLNRSNEINALGDSIYQGLGPTLQASGIHYKRELTVDKLHKPLGYEILIRSYTKDIDSILSFAKNENKSLQLYGLALYQAFYDILHGISGHHSIDSSCIGSIGNSDLSYNQVFDISHGTPKYRSINAFVWDIGDIDFRHMTNFITRRFKRRDRRNIYIEILEVPYGNINARFIENIIWLYEQGFHLAIDDLDIFRDKKDDVSNELLKVIGYYCTRIKLDWRVTHEFKHNKKLHRYLRSLREKHPNANIVMEGIHTSGDIQTFQSLANTFQISDYPN